MARKAFTCCVWIAMMASSSHQSGYAPSFDYPQFDYDDHQSTINIPEDRKPTEQRQRPYQFSNERSLTFSSNIQRVTEDEKRRLDAVIKRIFETPRNENGSYKIVNYPKPLLSTRQGQINNNGVPGSRDSVVFPGLSSRSTVNVDFDVSKIPEECRKLGICTGLNNYPDAAVMDVVSKLSDFEKKMIFKIDELYKPEIEQRFSVADDIDLCNSNQTLYFPELGQNIDGKWHIIVNNKQKPLQGFRVEICLDELAPCADVVQSQLSYKTYCKQKYMYRSMSALDGGYIVEKQIRLPSCCICVATPSGL